MLIGFVGSVFSPYYFRARRRGPTDPHQHCAFNVALYGGNRDRWGFSEYPARSLARDSDTLRLGANLIERTATALTWRIAEVGAPWPGAIEGVVRLEADTFSGHQVRLLPDREHYWTVLVPLARVSVDFTRPRLRWEGHGYLDTNSGNEPLEQAFSDWSWLRCSGRDTGASALVYSVAPITGPRLTHAFTLSPQGTAAAFVPESEVALAKTGWGIRRTLAADARTSARVLTTLESAPFYARSVVETTLNGQRMTGVHESLSLARFQSPWVRCLLPFRMRRSRR